jgi:bifunctional non-homologous end joining protein LigD
VIIPISHPDKILFPDDGITKGELAAYYEAIAAAMLPHIIGRPVTMERYHRGIDAPGFFQKDVSKGFPPWLERVEVPKHGGTVHHPIVTDVRSLVWLANQNCITPHVWTRRVSDLRHPDVCVFDLDPSDDERPEVLRGAAIALRDLLQELKLASWVKTTGSKGFHIVVPLDGSADLPTAAHFADAVGTLLVKRRPVDLTQEFHKADREGRILVDTGRNTYSATFAAAYAVRAKPGAPVSAPCTWSEVERGEVHPRSFTLRTMQARIAAAGDLWAERLQRGQPLGPAIERLRELQVKVMPAKVAKSRPERKPRGGRSGRAREI